MMEYRVIDNGMKTKPCFGMLSVPRTEGDISVGMHIVVTETTGKHEAITSLKRN
jgi:hypothetical protein